MGELKISIITVCYNAEETIEKTILSILSQSYSNIEYIVIDGLSHDNTMSIVRAYKEKIAHVLSEEDNGMYDGINKGIRLATGEVIGILNADDVLASNDVIRQIANEFINNSNLDSIFGDVAFFNNYGKKLRYYSSRKWNPNKFVWGYMPAHPSFYCKRELFDNLGLYRTDFIIGADYELLIRFLKLNKCSYKYLQFQMVNMRIGGISTRGLTSIIKINQEILKACEINGLRSNYFMLYSKYFTKIFELTRVNS
jgi:glycosyltransferase involved in cell wall biosynthesis